MFHAVICDPPYGIRAGARKTGCPGMELKPMTTEERATCIPATSVYPVADVCHISLLVVYWSTSLCGHAVSSLVRAFLVQQSCSAWSIIACCFFVTVPVHVRH